MRTVFFGTPELSVPALRALHQTTTVVGVVCQPDRPAGRGLRVHAPAVKVEALHLGLCVHQPVRVRTGTLHEWLAEREPDVAVVLAYGRILPPAVLAAPRFGCLNLHASLLPKYRGAAPIHWAIVNGETETGVSLMQMNEGCDTGPVYTQHRIHIAEDATAGTITAQIAELSARVVREDLPRAVAGEIRALPQRDSLACPAPPIRPEHLRIEWSRDARSIVNLVRGMAPAPGAVTTTRGRRLKVLAARTVEDRLEGPPGRITLRPGPRILVASASGSVALLRAQLEGRKVLDAPDLVNGRVVCDAQLLGG